MYADDEINKGQNITFPTTLFIPNRAPQTVIASTQLDLATGDGEVYVLTRFFVDPEKDEMTFAISSPGSSATSSWVSFQGTGPAARVTFRPSSGDTGDFLFVITANDGFGGQNTTMIRVSVALSSEEQFLMALRWILQVGGALAFCLAVYRLRVPVRNHVMFANYFWSECPEALLRGEAYRPHKKMNDEVLPVKPGNRCRVLELVDHPVNGWVFGLHCSWLPINFFSSKRAQMLDHRVELPLFYVHWLHWDALTNELTLTTDSLPPVNNIYLIQILDPDEYVLQEILIDLAAIRKDGSGLNIDAERQPMVGPGVVHRGVNRREQMNCDDV